MLLTTEGSNEVPVWSPDGEWVFFGSDRGGNYDIWKRRADRSLEAELVLDTEVDLWPTSISDDGEMLLFDSGDFPNRDVGKLALGRVVPLFQSLRAAVAVLSLAGHGMERRFTTARSTAPASSVRK